MSSDNHGLGYSVLKIFIILFLATALEDAADGDGDGSW